MEKYKCEICKKQHAVYRSIEIDLPNYILEMPEEEREKRIQRESIFCFVDNKTIFVNGYLNIESQNYESPYFYWKIWTSISGIDYQENLEKLIAGNIVEFKGKLENYLPFYREHIGLEANTLIQVKGDQIFSEVIITEESRLKEDQSNPISDERLIEIMQMIYHHPEREGKNNFDKPFYDRLSKELQNAKLEYIDNHKNFAIDLSNTSTNLFQIVNNKMLEVNSNLSNGFGLHLSFDDSFDECKEEIQKFRSKDYSRYFDFHNLDRIPTYQIDLGMNIEQLIELVGKIIVEVYEENPEKIEIDKFEV